MKTKTPTIPQMVARSLPGHRNALRALADDKPWPHWECTTAELRGAKKINATLRSWGCTALGGVPLGPCITDVGYELLKALEAK